MKLFGFNKKVKETKFRITEPDKNWVEDNFKWLIQVYGYPQRENEHIIHAMLAHVRYCFLSFGSYQTITNRI